MNKLEKAYELRLFMLYQRSYSAGETQSSQFCQNYAMQLVFFQRKMGGVGGPTSHKQLRMGGPRDYLHLRQSVH